MKKNVLTLLTLLAVVPLVGCNGKGTSSVISSSSSDSSSSLPPGPVIDTAIVKPIAIDTYETPKAASEAPDKLYPNHRIASIFKGEVYQLKCLDFTHIDGNNVSYTSKDTTVATVDETGKITGKKVGDTIVTIADKDHPEVSVDVPVYVLGDVDELDRKDMISELRSANNKDEIKKVVDYMTYEMTIKKEGVLQSYTRFVRDLVVSYDDAYFKMTEASAEIRTEGGAMLFGNEWMLFTTNKYYDTYVYRDGGIKKNYIRVPTASYMDKPQYTPALEVVESLFTAGKSFFTDIFDEASLKDFIDDASGSMKKTFAASGYDPEGEELGDFNLMFEASKTYSAESAPQSYETNFGIPANTELFPTVVTRYHARQKQLLNWTNDLSFAYKLGNDNYVLSLVEDHEYVRINDSNKSKYIVTPDRSQFNEVFSVFDLY